MRNPIAIVAARFSSFACLLTTLVASASADEILYQHPYPGVETTSAWCTACGLSYRVWDQFDLAEDSTITQIQARLYLNPATMGNPIEYSIWDTTRTTQLFSQSFAQGDLSVVNLGDPANDISADMTGLNLAAGSYALSIYHARSGQDFAWYQTEVTVQGRSFQTDGGGGTNKDMAFRIIGTAIPEPTSLTLFALGLLALTTSVRPARQSAIRS